MILEAVLTKKDLQALDPAVNLALRMRLYSPLDVDVESSLWADLLQSSEARTIIRKHLVNEGKQIRGEFKGTAPTPRVVTQLGSIKLK